MVSEMFTEAGVEERKTNHSLRAAGVSRLYEAGVDEKVIQSRSGHRRLESLRMYERVSPEQEQAVSNVLSSRHKTNYQYEVQQLVQCPEASPGPVVPASGMCTAVNTSSWHYNPVFERHVSSSQASQPSLSGFQCHNCTINVYQGPVSQPHNSGPTLCCPDSYEISEKDVESFNEF